jgi:hypothetical protein
VCALHLPDAGGEGGIENDGIDADVLLFVFAAQGNGEFHDRIFGKGVGRAPSYPLNKRLMPFVAVCNRIYTPLVRGFFGGKSCRYRIALCVIAAPRQGQQRYGGLSGIELLALAWQRAG